MGNQCTKIEVFSSLALIIPEIFKFKMGHDPIRDGLLSIGLTYYDQPVNLYTKVSLYSTFTNYVYIERQCKM